MGLGISLVRRNGNCFQDNSYTRLETSLINDWFGVLVPCGTKDLDSEEKSFKKNLLQFVKKSKSPFFI